MKLAKIHFCGSRYFFFKTLRLSVLYIRLDYLAAICKDETTTIAMMALVINITLTVVGWVSNVSTR